MAAVNISSDLRVLQTSHQHTRLWRFPLEDSSNEKVGKVSKFYGFMDANDTRPAGTITKRIKINKNRTTGWRKERNNAAPINVTYMMDFLTDLFVRGES